jgi:hypothetical protein
MKADLHNFLKLWWKGFAKGLPYDAKVQQLNMAASCMWLVGHPDVKEEEMDEMIKEWLVDTNPM